VRQPIGRLANAMTNEPSRSSQTFVRGVTVITLLIQTCVYTSVALLVSWYATVAILCAGFLILLAGYSLVSMSRRAGRRRTSLLQSLSARLADTLQSVKPLKAMAREDLADAVLATGATKLNVALRKSILSKAALRAAHEPMFTFVLGVGIFAALVFWQMPLATILILALVLFRLLDSLGKVQKEYQKMVTDESAYWSLRHTIEEAERSAEQSVGGQHITLTEGIRLTNVHLAYGEQPVLTDLSLEIPVGTFTTLIGLSGAGKTTIVDLVTGLLHPQAGEVTIDDTPLPHVDLRQWRRQIGYVPQDNLLLHDTILLNITLGDPTLGPADAAAALRAAGVWEYVESLPAGLATIVGERGMRLSGGQRQRIMIARALVHRPKLLILDEATTALDPETEAGICATLQQLVGDMTILAVSHQSALLDVADRVYRIQHGTAVPVVTSNTASL
jgi:ATP-binding cassette subfamily C protein